MTPVFADTYYWLALINPRDQAHQEALTLSQTLYEPLLTTAWVLTEVVGDAMHDPANRLTFVRLMDDIANDAQTTVISAEQKWFDRGLALFAASAVETDRIRRIATADAIDKRVEPDALCDRRELVESLR